MNLKTNQYPDPKPHPCWSAEQQRGLWPLLLRVYALVSYAVTDGSSEISLTLCTYNAPLRAYKCPLETYQSLTEEQKLIGNGADKLLYNTSRVIIALCAHCVTNEGTKAKCNGIHSEVTSKNEEKRNEQMRSWFEQTSQRVHVNLQGRTAVTYGENRWKAACVVWAYPVTHTTRGICREAMKGIRDTEIIISKTDAMNYYCWSSFPEILNRFSMTSSTRNDQCENDQGHLLCWWHTHSVL